MITAFLTYRMFFFKSITSHSAIFNLDIEKSAVIFFEFDRYVMYVIQIVALNIVKDGGMFSGGL